MSIKFAESQSRKSIHFSENDEDEVPNYEAKAREAARKAVKKEALRGSRETKIEVVPDILFVLFIK